MTAPEFQIESFKVTDDLLLVEAICRRGSSCYLGSLEASGHLINRGLARHVVKEWISVVLIGPNEQARDLFLSNLSSSTVPIQNLSITAPESDCDETEFLIELIGKTC